MSLLIGFNGSMGSGKSTAIDTLKASGIGPVYNVKFAGPLYAIQEFIYKIVSPVYQRPADFVKDRKLLQWLGTNWGRETIGENVWVDIWKARIAQVRSQDKDVIITCDDCRFDNEAKAIQALGGYVVRITRPNAVAQAIGGEGIKNHPSEAGLSPEMIDHTIENTGSLEEFQASLRKLFEQIKADQSAA